ncbi:hypothetical protein QLX08_007223 [Tetragonisca angustula]|uniref:Endonuclease/exonuclease/phosphatase domain-containing protein n=1 Tax=Tetragonisca angustula TaxID=166442 RepID=A0AAW0ZQL1_9HYME
MLWNATSVLNKKPEFQKFLHDQHIDIAIITETWLSSGIPFSLQNFHINRNDRTNNPDKHPRGGVLIALNNRIPTEDHPQPTSSVVETTAVKVKAAYVSRKHRITPEELDQITYKTSYNMYITGGDFNAKHHLWNNANKTNKQTNKQTKRTHTQKPPGNSPIPNPLLARLHLQTIKLPPIKPGSILDEHTLRTNHNNRRRPFIQPPGNHSPNPH